MVRSAYVYAVDVNWSYKFADFFLRYSVGVKS